TLGRQELMRWKVADGHAEVLVLLRVHDDRALGDLELPEDLREALGFDLGELEVADDDEPAFLELQRERAAKRADTHLAGRPISVATDLRTVRDAAADVRRGLDRTVTGVARALLAVELLSRARHERAVLHGGGTRTLRGALRLHHLVEEAFVDLGSKDGVR